MLQKKSATAQAPNKRAVKQDLGALAHATPSRPLVVANPFKWRVLASRFMAALGTAPKPLPADLAQEKSQP